MSKPTGSPLVECIPNISEGRRHDVIDRLARVIVAAEGVRLLHRTSDEDHNRSVFTYVGAPQAIVSATFRLIERASQLINMDDHAGVHPRLGAVDVVPFVPLRHITLEGCVQLARQLGEQVGATLGLPVYLYEAAAARPERRNLADVRRGEYELLKAQIHLPARQPDFGPATLGSAGAVIIGAREALIAYNVFLNTADVAIAKRIARAIRQSSGGLTGVKALGFLVDGQAQVSMNLTDYKSTPLYRVMTMIRDEAARYGVLITHSQLIGLIPQDALIDVATHHLQLHDFDMARILDTHLHDRL